METGRQSKTTSICGSKAGSSSSWSEAQLKASDTKVRITRQKARLQAEMAEAKAKIAEVRIAGEMAVLEAEEEHAALSLEVASRTSRRTLEDRVHDWVDQSIHGSLSELGDNDGQQQELLCDGRFSVQPTAGTSHQEPLAGQSLPSQLKDRAEQDIPLHLGRRMEQQHCGGYEVPSPKGSSHQTPLIGQSIPLQTMQHQQPGSSCWEQPLGAAEQRDRQQRPESYGRFQRSAPEITEDRLAESIGKAMSLYNTRPKVNDLPPFNGNPIEWIAFKSIFQHTTDFLKVSDSENLYRLQKALKGEAREAVSYLLLSPCNVKEIMITLENIFGNTDHIIQKTIGEIKGLSKLDENTGSDAIIRFSCKVKNLISMLKSFKNIGHLHNPDLLSTLVTKLPVTLRTLWLADKDRRNTTQPILCYLSLWLEEIVINSRDSGISLNSKTNNETKFSSNNNFKPNSNNYHPRQSNQYQNKQNYNRPYAPKNFQFERPYDTSKKFLINHTTNRDKSPCCVCNGDHQIWQCEKFKNISTTQRWEIAKFNNMCFKCLGHGHSRINCKFNFKSPNKKYHDLLINHNRVETNEIVTNTWENSQVLLKVIPITVYGPLGSLDIHALLDDGSTVTLLDQEVAEKIGLSGPVSDLSLHGVNDMNSNNTGSMSIEVKIKGKQEVNSYVARARTVRDLQIPAQIALSNSYISNKKHLKNAPYFENNVKPQMLIGQNNWELIISRNIVKGDKNKVSLSYTKLGWVALGHITKTGSNEFNFHIREDENNELHQLIKESFKLDDMGVVNPKICKDDRRAYSLLENTTKLNSQGSNWETGLLWKEDERYFPDSYQMAANRLLTLEKRMDRDNEFAEAYCKKIDHYIAKGFAKKSDISDRYPDSSDKFYLPHFAVYNPNKPGKLRVVFDAAAKSKGVSLNDRLLTGPDLYNSLLGMIFKFRQYEIAFTADIQEMFLQIRIIDDDTPFQLFLWRGKDRKVAPSVYVMKSMIFGAKSSPCSAQFVKNKNAEQFLSQYPQAVEAIKTKHYMDDYLDSVDSIDNAKKLIKDIMYIHAQGGFNITSWASNAPEALEHVPVAHRSKDVVCFEQSEINMQRTLGLQWDPNSDTLSFDLSFKKIPRDIISGKQRPTKRQMLKVIMTVFDPPGFLAPLTVRSKILLQNVWRSGTDWDNKLNDRNFNEWLLWLEELKTISNVQIPRYYEILCKDARVKAVERQLHIFCDASEKAMCCVAYSRVKNSSGQVFVNFIASKTRVAPIKPMSIPRLELQAALLGSRLYKSIIGEHTLTFNSKHFWTDSKTVMCWLKSDSRNFKPFVSHRLGELEETVGSECWRWLPTKENIADEATRDTNMTDLTLQGRWFSGPEFLKSPPEVWPQENVANRNDNINKELLELKPSAILITTSAACFIDPYKFSKYSRLLRATAYVFKFISKCRRKPLENNSLTAEDLIAAERFLIKESQKRTFNREIMILTKKEILPKDSRLRQLSAYLDVHGILRIQGRIEAIEDVQLSTVFPIILDNKDRLAHLLITQFHEKSSHGGVEHVLNAIRQKYWILNARQSIRKIHYMCQTCKNKKAQPQAPLMGCLPMERLQHHIRPFTHTGMDYFGPMKVTIGRRNEKRYGVLFTCMSTRAVHIEIADSLTTDSAILAIRRFVARRGYPQTIWSDNGTNLRGADKVLSDSLSRLNQEKINDEMSVRKINWKFNPPASPHHGGSWESLVKSIKSTFYAILHEQAPRPDTLHTLLLEAENIVNSRPLTHVSLDSKDFESLTPNHFLLGYKYDNPIVGAFDQGDLCLKKQWRIAQFFADQFWSRWVKEYLPTLVKRSKWHDVVPPIRVGDVAIICDNTLPRNTWPKGIVVKVYPGTDKQVRVVDIQTNHGTFRRPATKVAVLKIQKSHSLPI